MQPFEDPSDPSVQHASNPFAAPAPVEIDTSVPMDNRPFHPVSSIWLHPRITIRQILDRDPNLYVILLVCISGIGESLDRASLRNMGDQVPLVAILVLACLLGPIGGLIQLYIGSWLLRWTGSWIGGTAPSSHLRTAIAWSSVPAIAAMVLWVPQLVIFGEELFTEETPRLAADPILPFVLIGISLLEFALGIWGIFLLCNTIAEVQGFKSAWKGLGNLLLAGLIIVVPLFFIIFAVLLVVAAG